jgi:TP901 family phage tail tape measure protein
MPSEIADLFVILRAETAPFLSSMRTAGEEGEAFTGKMAGPLGILSKIGVVAGAAGIGVAIASVKMAGDFQASMQKLVSTAGESQGALKGVSDGVLKMAVDTGTSTKELADGMYMVESAGFHGAEGLTVLKAAAEGARAEQAPLAEVSNAVTSALKSYHLPATDAVTVTNEMIAAVGHGKTTFGEFAGSLSTVLPIASSAKLGFDQIGGAIATLTNHGTSAREATQELANTIRNLQAPNNVAVQEMQRLGLSSTDISTKLGERGLTGTIQLLSQTVLQHMGPAGTLLLSTFNTSKQAADDANQMIAAMPASLQNLARSFQQGKISVADWRAQLKTLPVDQANLASQFATLINRSQGFSAELKRGGPATQTYNAAMKQLMGGATGLNTALMLGGENMTDFRNNVAAVGAAAKSGGKDVEGWAEIQQTFNFKLDQLKETVITLAIKLGTALMPYVEKFMGWVQSGIGWLTQHRGAVMALAGAIGTTLVAAIIAIGGAMATALGPEVAIAAGIMALGAALVYAYNHCAAFRSIVNEVGRVLGGALIVAFRAAGAVVHWFATTVLPLVRDAIQAVFGWFAAHKETFRAAWDAVLKAVLAIVQWFNANVLSWLRARVGELVAWWTEHSQQIHQVWSVVWNIVKTAVEAWWDGFMRPTLSVIQSVWTVVWGVIKDTIKIVWDLISGAVTTGIHYIENVIGLVLDIITLKWGRVWGDLGHLVGQALNDVVDTIGNVASGFGNLLWDAGANIIRGLINGIRSMAGGAGRAMGDIASTIRSYLPFSPAKTGPLSGSGSPDLAGAKIGTMVADGIHTSVTGVSRAAGRLAGAASLAIGGGAQPGVLAAGAGGSSAPTYVINVTVQGSVHSERDLRDVIERQMYQLGMRGSSTWQPYARR